MEEGNNNLCGNTYTSEYSSTEPCEQVSTDCVIYESSISELSLDSNSSLTNIVASFVASLVNLSSLVNNVINGKVTKQYTVEELPSGTLGQIATVTDASAISYRAVSTGGGTDNALVFYDGTNWIYH